MGTFPNVSIGVSMSFFPKPQCIRLPNKQKIMDVAHKISLSDGHNLLIAGTGLGKTTYVLQHLAKQRPIILLCPMVSQIKQLQQDYASSKEMVFSHGEMSNREEVLSAIAQKKSVVMTFDQWLHYRHATYQTRHSPATQLNFDPYTLVIDEVHKLSSAGSYRDKAIQPILATISSNQFSQVLYLTATPTEHLCKMIIPALTRYFHIEPSNPVQRQITITHYDATHILNFYPALCKRLESNALAGQSKIALVRVNNKDDGKAMQAMLAQKGYRVMLINRDEMNSKSCRDILQTSELSLNYDVIICTSILDEAVNLNNRHNEIDSIHFIGRHAHPEEIVQFIGRTRQVNPPIFIHLSQEMSKTKIDCRKMHTKIMDELEGMYLNMISFLTSIRNMFSQDKIRDLGDMISSKVDYVKMLNNMSNEAFEVRAFWHDGQKIILNKSNLVAKLYRTDLAKCYSNIHYLQFRIQQLLPNAKITLSSSACQVNKALDKAFKQAKIALIEHQKQVVPDVMASLVRAMKSNSIKDYPKVTQYLEDSDILFIQPYKKDEQPLHYEIFGQAVFLAQYVTNLEDAHQILLNDKIELIRKIDYDYQSNPIVKAVMFGLGNYLKKSENLNITHTVNDIERRLNKYLQRLDCLATTKHFLAQHPFKYVELVEDKILFKHDQIINFLKRYTHVQILNDKKSLDCKKIIFLSIGGGFGYSYQASPKTQHSKKLQFEQKLLDKYQFSGARFGHLIANLPKEELIMLDCD